MCDFRRAPQKRGPSKGQVDNKRCRVHMRVLIFLLGTSRNSQSVLIDWKTLESRLQKCNMPQSIMICLVRIASILHRLSISGKEVMPSWMGLRRLSKNSKTSRQDTTALIATSRHRKSVDLQSHTHPHSSTNKHKTLSTTWHLIHPLTSKS